MLPLLILISSAWADCPASATALRADLDAAQQAYEAQSWDQFASAFSDVENDVGCLLDVVNSSDASRVHLVHALAAARASDTAAATVAFRGQLATDPTYDPPFSLAPPGSLLRTAFENSRKDPGAPSMALAEGSWYLDGMPASELPGAQAAVVQRFDGQGGLSSWYLSGLDVPAGLADHVKGAVAAPTPEPTQRTSSSSSAPSRQRGLELGLGMRNGTHVTSDPGTLEGPRVVGRMLMGSIALEAAFFLRLNQQMTTDLTESIVLIAHQGDSDANFQQPFTVDRFTFAGLIDWNFGARAAKDLWSAGPHLYGGLEARRYETYYATYNDEYSSGEGLPASVSAPVGSFGLLLLTGFGVDITCGRFSLRPSWYARFAYEEAPDYDPNDDASLDKGLRTYGMFALDMLVSL